MRVVTYVKPCPGLRKHSMRVLVIWDFYPKYLSYFQNQHPQIRELGYQDQLGLLLDDRFTWPCYLTAEFRERGHEAQVIVGNAASLQKAWCLENDYSSQDLEWQLSVVAEQVRRFRPDIAWLGGADRYLGAFSREIKKYAGALVAWRAVPWPQSIDWSAVDLVLSSHAHFVDEFRAAGHLSRLVLPCFDPDLLRLVQSRDRDIPVSFVGTLSSTTFGRRIDFLKNLQRHVPLQIYSERLGFRRRPWPLKTFLTQARLLPFLLSMRRYPPVYGLEMFKVLSRSRIVVNAHIDAALSLAGNIRMFEATGTGALLVTEAAPNVDQLFEPDKEIITYRTAEEAAEKIAYYLGHESERAIIAQAGQRRTLQHYSCSRRAEELIDIFTELLT